MADYTTGLLARLLTADSGDQAASEIVAELDQPNPTFLTRLEWGLLTPEQRDVGVALVAARQKAQAVPTNADGAVAAVIEVVPDPVAFDAKLIADSDRVTVTTPSDKPLALRFETAYRSYKHAELKLANQGVETVTDPMAWEFLNKNGFDGYTPEPLKTWERYVREARKFYNDRKNTPRGGREGGSMVRPDETDTLRSDVGE